MEPAEFERSLAQRLANQDLPGVVGLLRDAGQLHRACDLLLGLGYLDEAAALATELSAPIVRLRVALRRGDETTQRELLAVFTGPQTEPAVCRAAAEELLASQRIEAAVGLFEHVGDLDRALSLATAGELHSLVGRLHEKMQQPVLALAAYRRALAALQDPLSLAALPLHEGIAQLALQTGQPEEAVSALQVAIALLHDCTALAPKGGEDALLVRLKSLRLSLVACFHLLEQPELAERLFSLLQRDDPALAADGHFAAYVRRHEHAGQPHRALLLSRYRIVRLIGVGSVGRVYCAEDVHEKALVALKFFPFAEPGSPDAAQGLVRRFTDEAKRLMASAHPHVVTLHAVHAGLGLLVMEYLPGGSLATVELPLSLRRLRRILLETCAALSHVHGLGLLHRDIKPHNLFVTATGRTKLGDFGAATLQELGMTQTEGLMGTLAYLAPELARGDRPSSQVDVYGLGVTAYQLLTGRLPFVGPDFLSQHRESVPADPRQHRPAIPAAWASLLLRMLHKQPDERSLGIAALAQEIAALPTDDLPGDQPDAGRDAALPAQESVETAEPAALSPEASPNPRTAARAEVLCVRRHSEVLLTTDATLLRPVLVERFAAGVLQGAAGATQLDWLRQLAACAGPGLQRILRIDLASSACAQVHYEVVPLSSPPVQLSSLQLAQVRRVLLRLHGAGIVHGAVARAVALVGDLPILAVAGLGPLHATGEAPPTVAEDLAQLAKFE